MSVLERLSKAEERLNAYYEAELTVLSGQAYRIGTRSLNRADLGEIRRTIQDLENLVESLKAQSEGKGFQKAFRITPRDL